MEFRRRWWMLSRHVETIVAACGRAAAVDYRRHIVKTPDNDEVAIDAVCGDGDKPLLVIFHGLEGSSNSGSVRRIAAYFGERRWNVAVPHFRTCGGLMNHQARAYHAADVDEIDWMLRQCRAMFAHDGLFAAGISLGGNALMNWAGRCSDDDDGNYDNAGVAAMATISAPFDLAASVRAMGGGINHLLYERHFMQTLRAKITRKQQQNPEWFINNNDNKQQQSINKLPPINLDKVRTLASFDDCYTAPAHGFANAADYWHRASCAKALPKIKLPLLCINAQNDPIIPPSSLPTTAPANIKFLRPKHGAHAAFLGTPQNWLHSHLQSFFTQNHQ